MKHTIIIILISLLYACDYGGKSLTQNFEISWVNLEETRTLRYNSEGVGVGYTHKVGYNDNYIIVLGENGKNNKAYYIIDIKEYSLKWGKPPERQGRLGPLDKKKFDKTLKQLNQTDLEFTLEYNK